MSEVLRSRDPEQLTPYEAVLRSFAHFPRLSAEEHAAATGRLGTGRPASAGLCRWLGHAVDAVQGGVHARVQRSAGSHRTRASGCAACGRGRAIESPRLSCSGLGPILPAGVPGLSELRGTGHRTQPHGRIHRRLPGIPDRLCRRLGARLRAGRSGPGASIPIIPDGIGSPPSSTPTARSDYRGALDFALKVNMPGFWRTNFALAAAYGQLGEREAARNAVQRAACAKAGLPRRCARGTREVVGSRARRAPDRWSPQGWAGGCR